MNPKAVKDLKQFIKNELEPINNKLDGHDEQFSYINEKLDSLTLDMANVQKKTDAIADIRDMLKGTKAQVNDHEERIATLEQAA